MNVAEMNAKRYASLLSKEECETIVSRYFKSKYNLLEYKLRPISDELEGFLGQHMWLEVAAEHQNEIKNLSFFAKFAPTVDEVAEYCKQILAFGNEVWIFEKLIPEFKKYYPEFDSSFLPKYYFSRGDELIVLENCVLTNYEVFDSPDILPLDHIRLVLKTLAKFHAASFIYEERKSEEMKQTYRLTDEYDNNLKESFFQFDTEHLGYKWQLASEKCMHLIIDRMPEERISREQFKQKFSELVLECFQISQPSSKFRNVVCHADMWRNNVMFRYENGVVLDCKLIDFQLVKYNPPIYDVLKFFHQVTSSETRQHHFDDLIYYYYSQLALEMKLGGLDPHTMISFDELKASCKCFLPYVKIEAAFYYTFQRVGLEYMKNVSRNKDHFTQYVFYDRAEIIDLFYLEGSYFKKWMDEILLEIKDIILNDNFSREDCRVVIKNTLNTTDYELLKYNVKLLNEQNGFLGTHKKILATVKQGNEEKTLKYFAKFLPTTEFSEFAIESGAFDNECFVYNHVFELMDSLNIDIYKYVAKCCFTRRNDVLVFGDLTELGFTPVNKHKPLNYKQLLVILKALAGYHACCFVLEEKLSKQSGKIFRIVNEYSKQLQEVVYIEESKAGKKPIQSLIKGISTHIDIFPDSNSKISDEELKRKVDIIFNKLMYEYSAPSTKYRNVICHGDLWASNILLKHDAGGNPVQAKFVDFQCIKKCPPAQDLMALVYLTTSRKFRSKCMNDILKYYHEQLRISLKDFNYNVNDILPINDFFESCEYYKTFAISQTVSHFHLILTNAEHMKELFQDDSLCHKTFYEDRSEFITKMCAKDPQYKVVLAECLADFRMMCENLDI